MANIICYNCNKILGTTSKDFDEKELCGKCPDKLSYEWNLRRGKKYNYSNLTEGEMAEIKMKVEQNPIIIKKPETPDEFLKQKLEEKLQREPTEKELINARKDFNLLYEVEIEELKVRLAKLEK